MSISAGIESRTSRNRIPGHREDAHGICLFISLFALGLQSGERIEGCNLKNEEKIK